MIGRLTTEQGVEVEFRKGSLLNFTGDAIVNAANNGGVGGHGIDGLINEAAGAFEMKQFRRGFNGIETGCAKISPSFRLTTVKHVIHAVGPVFRHDNKRDISEEEKETLLANAYTNSLNVALENNCTTVGFCLISAGVFRGNKPLHEVIRIAVDTLVQQAKPPMTTIALFAFTQEEQDCLKEVLLQHYNSNNHNQQSHEVVEL